MMDTNQRAILEGPCAREAGFGKAGGLLQQHVQHVARISKFRQGKHIAAVNTLDTRLCRSLNIG